MFHTKYKKRRRFAFDIWSDEQGFTLAQAIWQLQLFLLLSVGCMLLLSIVEKTHPFAEINKFSQMEWKQTVLQLEEDLNCAVAVRAVKNGTALEYISSQGRVVTIEPYQEMLRNERISRPSPFITKGETIPCKNKRANHHSPSHRCIWSST